MPPARVPRRSLGRLLGAGCPPRAGRRAAETPTRPARHPGPPSEARAVPEHVRALVPWSPSSLGGPRGPHGAPCTGASAGTGSPGVASTGTESPRQRDLASTRRASGGTRTRGGRGFGGHTQPSVRRLRRLGRTSGLAYRGGNLRTAAMRGFRGLGGAPELKWPHSRPSVAGAPCDPCTAEVPGSFLSLCGGRFYLTANGHFNSTASRWTSQSRLVF
ncbi:uncharacterized protein RHO17_014795 [Thomomys bottae]